MYFAFVSSFYEALMMNNISLLSRFWVFPLSPSS